MRSRYALLPAVVPVLALIGGLPFVNHLQPVVLGLPFLLFWTLAWVLMTPVFLGIAYWIQQSAGAAGRGPRGRPFRSSEGSSFDGERTSTNGTSDDRGGR